MIWFDLIWSGLSWSDLVWSGLIWDHGVRVCVLFWSVTWQAWLPCSIQLSGTATALLLLLLPPRPWRMTNVVCWWVDTIFSNIVRAIVVTIWVRIFLPRKLWFLLAWKPSLIVVVIAVFGELWRASLMTVSFAALFCWLQRSGES